MNQTDIIDRQFLQDLREAANGMASGNLNPDWVRAYQNLADAADRLDAMQARITAIQGEGRPLEIGTESGWAKPYGDGVDKEVD